MTLRAFVDPSSNFHPYECDGPGECIHCDRTHLISDKAALRHDPATCDLCDPDYDGRPNRYRKVSPTIGE